jgi:hypothetical protein
MITKKREAITQITAYVSINKAHPNRLTIATNLGEKHFTSDNGIKDRYNVISTLIWDPTTEYQDMWSKVVALATNSLTLSLDEVIARYKRF